MTEEHAEALDLGKLREVASAATPGPWGRATTDGMGWAVHRGEHETVALYADRDDAEHIATFDPPTVLALIERVERAEAAVERVRTICVPDWRSNRGHEHQTTTEAYAAGRNALLDDLRSALEADR